MSIPKLLGRALTVLFAGVLALAFVPSPPAHAATGITFVSAHTVKPAGSLVTATVQVTPATAGHIVYPEHSVNGSAFQGIGPAVRTDAAGRATVEFGIGNQAVATTQWRVRAIVGGVSYFTRVVDVTYYPNVKLVSAPGIAASGQSISAKVDVNLATLRSIGFIDVWVGNRWSRSSQVTITPDPVMAVTRFQIPITYGRDTPGVYTFRAGSTINGITGYSGVFRITRTSSLSLQSAPGSLRVGQAGVATGRLLVPATAARRANLQVVHGGAWVTIGSGTANSSGYFSVPMSYGVSARGTYTYRFAYSSPTGNLYSRAWTVTRY